MANEEVKKKLLALGAKVQGRQLNLTEQVLVEKSLAKAPPKSRSQVRQVLAESLNKTETDVLTKLASHDDSDRLIDEIVNVLNK